MTLRLAGRAFFSDAMRWKLASAFEEWNLLPQPQTGLVAEQRAAVRRLFAEDIIETSRLISSDLNAVWH